MAAWKTVNNTTAGKARLEARITHEQKAILERAADVEGRTITDYIVAHLIPLAEETVRQQGVLKLTSDDVDFFVRTLMDPPSEPNEHLRAAFELRRKLLSN